MDTLFFLLLFSPLIGFAINGLRFRSKNPYTAGSIATGAIGISFVSAVTYFLRLSSLPVDERAFVYPLFSWLSVGSLSVDFSFTIDPLSSVMILIITGVGLMIHIFSMGYMNHDERPAKYFAYLNLFVFNMLVLVLGSNLLVMFVGWEGVGLCSYLLIGFWFSDPAKAAAGMKAFVTNRIGDAGFLLGLFLVFSLFGTIDFASLRALDTSLLEAAGWPLTLACLFLFVGACGKSAQIPLYVWLPDAMAGPTPVSALIHAATMVTAGVYMIIRTNGLFIYAPDAMMVVAYIGAFTALVAASIGITQNDIKKVLAYSTVSQLGYMFLAVGVGAWGAGLAHLMTHAFFKALMFLGAGSVIHSMHHEQDMRKMGGLKKAMPITHFTFLMGWLAIIGAPFFSGFFSKDEILWMSIHSPRGSLGLWVMGVVAAFMTAFYMTRLMAMTFWSESRVSKEVHPHESPVTMTLPLCVLGFLSVFAGFLCVPHGLGSLMGHFPNLLEHWVEPLLTPVPGLTHGSLGLELALMGITMVGVAFSAYMAYLFYVRSPEKPLELAQKLAPLHRASSNKYWVDEFYFGALINPLIAGSRKLWSHVDVKLIDGATFMFSGLVRNASGGLRSIQNGNLQAYAFYIVFGLVACLFFILERS